MKVLAASLSQELFRTIVAQEMIPLLLNYFCITFTVRINFVVLRISVKTTTS